jgi:chemotaxis protein CheX
MKPDEYFRNSSMVILSYFKINIKKIELLKKEAKDADIDLSVFVGITGNPRGLISFEMSNKTAMEITRSVGSATRTSLSKSQRDIMREISNQICGNALTDLWEHGYDSEMTPPSLISGDEIVYHYSSRCKKVFYLFDTDCGKFLVKTFLELK